MFTPLYFPTSVDSTMLSAFDSCPQKFLMEFILRKVPIGRSIHLHAGGCMASAFEVIRQKFYKEKWHLDDCLHHAFPVFVREWGDMETPEGEYKDMVNCWSAVEAYFREYPPATDYFQPYTLEDGSPAVEFKFAIPMQINHPDTGEPLLFSGRADMLSCPIDSPNTVYVVDEKTSKALGPKWQYQWGMRGQFYGYTYAAKQYGYPCVGALVRGIAIQQTQFAFQEKPLFLDDYQLEVWWLEAHKKVARMIEMYERAKKHYPGEELETNYMWLHGSFDKSFGDACQSYGGCMYTDLCTHPMPWVMWKGYETRIWDPLAKDPAHLSENRQASMGELSWQEFMGEG